jgi:predicted dinucleotide-binding enzyme
LTAEKRQAPLTAMEKIGVLGSGMVGKVLADGFLALGHEVVRGTRDPAKLAEWQASAGPRASVATFADAAKSAQLLVLAVKGTAAEQAVDACGAEALAGKVVIDATNPISDEPPENGVIRFFTGPNESLMERLQTRATGAHFVKAFSCVGNALMINPSLGGLKPTMFICGNDAGAKARVTSLLEQIGWEAEDMGMATAARAIEPLCILWCIPGFLRNDWNHAFKVLKA